MNDKVMDVIVIGDGMAGVTAAKAAMDGQANVGILTKGAGATLMGSGALDILGAVPGEERNTAIEDITQGIETLLKKYPNHPYSVLKDSLEDGMKAFREICRAGGMEFSGDGVSNVAIPNILGTFKNTAYIPSYNKNADVTEAKGKILVVGFKGHTEFYPEYACKSYNEFQKQFLPKADAQYIATTLELPSFAERTKLANAELASFMDTPEGIEELAIQLKELKNIAGGIQRILLPPILGYENYIKNTRMLYETLQIPVGEIAAGGHSVSAQRLSEAIRLGLKKLGIEITDHAKALDINRAEDGMFHVLYEYQGKQMSAYAKQVVLAVGGFIGGGISSCKEDIYVPVLKENLGRITPDQVSKKAFPSGGHNFAKVGIKVYGDMTIAQGGFSGQVYACGDLLEGYDWIYERSGAGVAAASGFLAGKNAAVRAKGCEY